MQTLRAKVQQCAPCTPSPSTITHNEQLARLQQENNARHDLLLALGLNDQVQTRYLESASKRHALESILRDDAPPTDLDLPAVVSPSMYGQAPERANAGRERPGDVRDVAEASGSMTGPMDCHDSLSHAPDFAGPTTGMDAMVSCHWLTVNTLLIDTYSPIIGISLRMRPWTGRRYSLIQPAARMDLHLLQVIISIFQISRYTPTHLTPIYLADGPCSRRTRGSTLMRNCPRTSQRRHHRQLDR